jgi:hypothetical protein
MSGKVIPSAVPAEDTRVGAHRGSCFCGAVEIEVTGAPLEMGYCHCNSCRSHSGAPLSAYILWKAEDVRVTRGAESLGRFNRTGMSDRQFCRICGGHIMTAHPGLDLVDVRPAVIPSLAFRPTLHLHYAETVLPMKDGLLKLQDFPAEAGGSGEVIPE